MPLAYTINSELSQKIETLEIMRKDLHVMPIDRKKLLIYTWNCYVSRIEGALGRDGIFLSRLEINKILRGIKTPSDKARTVLLYKHALDYVRNEWYANSQPISPQTLITLQALLLTNSKKSSSKKLTVNSQQVIKQLLDYLQSGDEHPIIQAGIAYAQLSHNEVGFETTSHLATLLCYTFLYKYGWDFRELVTLEKAWLDNSADYTHALSSIREYNNSTVWLDFFTDTLIHQVEEIFKLLKTPEFKKNNNSFLDINSRQKEIIAYLEDPRSQITNKKVQELFGVSQITASRDLSKLAILGLIFVRGKGRSVNYSRA